MAAALATITDTSVWSMIGLLMGAPVVVLGIGIGVAVILFGKLTRVFKRAAR